MTSHFSVRARLVATVLMAVVPALAVMYYTQIPAMGFLVGLLALAAAWIGGEAFVMRQMRQLLRTTEKLAHGEFSSRTGLSGEYGEFGDLARRIDSMAEQMELRAKEQENSEKTLLTRSLQQTVVSALGQFALVSTDLSATVDQAVMLIAQTLEVEYCHVLKLTDDSRSFLLRAGVGWKPGLVGEFKIAYSPEELPGLALKQGEPILTQSLRQDRRFKPTEFLLDHGVVSSVAVPISGHGKAFGVLGAHTANKRKFTDDEVQFLVAVATVLYIAVEREVAEARQKKLAAFAQLNPNAAMEISLDCASIFPNAAAQKLSTTLGRESLASVLPTGIQEIVQRCLETGQSILRHETKLETHTLSWSFHPVRESQVVHAYVEDITDRLALEAQLRQSQKMESVGQLAAGVAHDFNNMLTVIQGHAGILLSRANVAPEVTASAQAITFASERASSLTRQLLVFSRRSILQPQSVEVADVVANMSKMLGRLLGETIRLQLERTPGTSPVHADPGMLEQVLLNLVVNARDAMPEGGTVTISTYPVKVDEEYVKSRADARTGQFVCLKVSDTGCGMDTATKARIFEPFFTTKEVGKGTGLGLATVYGIVKQHTGWIEVQSEPGKGTSFLILLPATQKQVENKVTETAVTLQERGGSETILVVEDEAVLREMTTSILGDSGYQVLSAGSGPEALKLWETRGGEVDLLLTDMVMPEGISGIDLARRLRETKPSLKVVFASGYSLDDFKSDFGLKEQSSFIQKPYTHGGLMRTIRECLDGAPHTVEKAVSAKIE
jgi:signal transduction histidine kinase/CheY-like chemotaxis protein